VNTRNTPLETTRNLRLNDVVALRRERDAGASRESAVDMVPCYRAPGREHNKYHAISGSDRRDDRPLRHELPHDAIAFQLAAEPASFDPARRVRAEPIGELATTSCGVSVTTMIAEPSASRVPPAGGSRLRSR